MEEFTIYCTTNQTIKAFELGAPIKEDYRYKEDIMFEEKCLTCERQLVPPTAEQMVGFLRGKGIKFQFDDEIDYWCVSIDDDPWAGASGFGENKELAAIDAALDYLLDNKK